MKKLVFVLAAIMLTFSSMVSAQETTSFDDYKVNLMFGINQPFKKQNNFLKGIMVAPSIRWWPRVSSTLENDEFTYNNRSTQSEVTHKAMEVGVNNTPLIVNISVGYSFNWKKNKQ